MLVLPRRGEELLLNMLLKIFQLKIVQNVILMLASQTRLLLSIWLDTQA